MRGGEVWWWWEGHRRQVISHVRSATRTDQASQAGDTGTTERSAPSSACRISNNFCSFSLPHRTATTSQPIRLAPVLLFNHTPHHSGVPPQ